MIKEYFKKHYNINSDFLAERYIDQHRKYGTLLELIDDSGKQYAWARVNILNPSIALVLDMEIEKEYRGKLDTIRELSIMFHERFPSVKYIQFYREAKNRKHGRIYKIEQLIKE